MADTYEQNLAQKTSLTTSDYIRVVGSDNVSYKQQLSTMQAPYREPSGTDLIGTITALPKGTYFYRMDNVSGFPVTGGVVYRIVKTHGASDARASILAIPMSATANIYTAFITSASATSITWVAQPTRAELTPTSESLTAGTNITFATGYKNSATKVGSVVSVEFGATASAAIASNTAIATIPSGYRPSKQVRAIWYYTDGYARLVFEPSGTVTTLTALASGKSVIGTITYIV